MYTSNRPRPTVSRFKSILAAISVSVVGLISWTPLVSTASEKDGSAEATHGGTLNWIVTPEPASVIPLTTTAGTNAELGPKIVEGLLTYDDELNPLPLLATDWDISDDGLQYTFRLRKGVKWHDGANFTSEDVAFSLM